MAYGSTSRASSSRTKKTNTLRLEKPLSSDRKPVKIGDDSTGLLLEDEKVIIEDLEVNRLTVNKGTLTKINGTITLENGERIHNDEDGVLSFQSPIYYFNSASQHITSCQVALIASTGEDCSISFIEAGGVHWNIGLDQDDSDKLKWGNNAVVGTSTQMTLDKSGNLTLVGDLQVNGDDIKCDGAMNLEAEGGAITLDASTGNFLAKKDGTEFSATNSAYAGMILGYTDIGLDEGRATLTLTTSYVVPTDEFSVSFKAPPSGNVEIMISVRFNAGSSGLGDLYAGLSSGNASLGYVQLADFHEEFLIDQSGRNSVQTIQNYWTLTGLTAGTAYEYWVGFKSSSTTGTPMLEYGGSVSGHNPDFIMKATALPATITT